MGKVEAAIRRMEEWANDPARGYDQSYRWGQRGDYDCSAAVIQAWEDAGVPVKSAGASNTWTMYGVFLAMGFSDVTGSVNRATAAGMKRGDVLLNVANHAAMYCGNGLEVEASINEFGGITGGQPGDQTGEEFLIRPYRNYPWDYVLRYTEEEGSDYVFSVGQVCYGDQGKDVYLMQALLRGRGYLDQRGKKKKPIEVDGLYGDATASALRYFQEKNGLLVDGICGPATWEKLLRR